MDKDMERSGVERLQQACHRLLRDAEFDVVAFVDVLIDVACDVGVVGVSAASGDDVVVSAAAEERAVSIAAGKAKLRAACARLAVLVAGDGGAPALYGGRGKLAVRTDCSLSAEWVNVPGDVRLELSRD